jgi:predicted aspartyl protease
MNRISVPIMPEFDGTFWRPVVMLFVEDCMAHFIVDTGASNTVIAQHFYDEYLTHLTPSRDEGGIGASGHMSLKVIHPTIKISMVDYSDLHVGIIDMSAINKVYAEHNAMPIDGMLGCDILMKGRYVIDFLNKNLTFDLK